jgi:hypothetical protein
MAAWSADHRNYRDASSGHSELEQRDLTTFGFGKLRVKKNAGLLGPAFFVSVSQ